jgi:hypothetical protein
MTRCRRLVARLLDSPWLFGWWQLERPSGELVVAGWYSLDGAVLCFAWLFVGVPLALYHASLGRAALVGLATLVALLGARFRVVIDERHATLHHTFLGVPYFSRRLPLESRAVVLDDSWSDGTSIVALEPDPCEDGFTLGSARHAHALARVLNGALERRRGEGCPSAFVRSPRPWLARVSWLTRQLTVFGHRIRRGAQVTVIGGWRPVSGDQLLSGGGCVVAIAAGLGFAGAYGAAFVAAGALCSAMVAFALSRRFELCVERGAIVVAHRVAGVTLRSWRFALDASVRLDRSWDHPQGYQLVITDRRDLHHSVTLGAPWNAAELHHALEGALGRRGPPYR